MLKITIKYYIVSLEILERDPFCWWQCKPVQLYSGNQYGGFPKTKNRSLPLLGIYPKECKLAYNRKTNTLMYTEHY
jgi:hypothetical protein